MSDKALARLKRAGYVTQDGSLDSAVSAIIYDRDCQSQYIEELRLRNTEFLDMVERLKGELAIAQNNYEVSRKNEQDLISKNQILQHDIDELKNEPYEI